MNNTQIEKAYAELPKKQNLTVSMKRLETAYGISHGYLVRALENFDTSQGITLEHFRYLVESEFIRLESAESGSALALRQSAESAPTQHPTTDRTPYFQDLNDQLKQFAVDAYQPYERSVEAVRPTAFDYSSMLATIQQRAEENHQREQNIRQQKKDADDALELAMQLVVAHAGQRGQAIGKNLEDFASALEKEARLAMIQQSGIGSQPAPKADEPGDGSPQ